MGEKHSSYERYTVSVLFWVVLSILTQNYIYKEKIIRSMNRKRAVKIPYEGYTLPPSSEKGGQFVDFKRIIERKPVKVVKRRRKDETNN